MPPRLDADGLGKSAPTRPRKVGADAAPDVGPAQTALAICVFSDPVSVPVVVTGLPETVKMPGRDRPTDVTVPEPTFDHCGLAPAPCVVRMRPVVPGGRTFHPDTSRKRISPWVAPMISRTDDGVFEIGAALPPVTFA